eukprot:scaffold7769_cov53-Attheya_sp.AAC.10
MGEEFIDFGEARDSSPSTPVPFVGAVRRAVVPPVPPSSIGWSYVHHLNPSNSPRLLRKIQKGRNRRSGGKP